MPLFLKVDEMSDSVKSFAVNDSIPKARSRRSKKKKKKIIRIRVLPVVPLGAETATKALTFFLC
jgi:hypothetical protein